jgi:hypothetical protein
VTLHPSTTYHYRVLAARAAQTEDTIEWEAPTVHGADQTFTTPGAAPVVESESASSITPTDAMLEAQINPGGLETTYEFKLEAPSCQSVNPPGSCEASGGVQIASGSIPAGSSPQTVSVDIAQVWQALTPNTSYAYSVNAANSAGEDFGNQKEFTTPPASAQPSIESESASSITPTDAMLEAQINPGDAPAGVYYQFQLVSDPGEYSSEIICPPEPSSGPFHPCIGTHSASALPIGFVPPGPEPSSVSLDLASAGVTLHPSTTYHYRVLAARAAQTEDTIEWEAPTVHGADQTFTTPPYPPPTTDPLVGDAGHPTIQSPPFSHHRRHRRHRRKHRRLLHRSKVHQASLAG